MSSDSISLGEAFYDSCEEIDDYPTLEEQQNDADALPPSSTPTLNFIREDKVDVINDDDLALLRGGLNASLRRASLQETKSDMKKNRTTTQDGAPNTPDASQEQQPAGYNDYLRAQRRLSCSIKSSHTQLMKSVEDLEFEPSSLAQDGDAPRPAAKEEMPEQQDEPNHVDGDGEEQTNRAAPLRGRLYRTMSVMAPRIADPVESAVWESMVHNLDHKIKKLETDGHFRNEDQDDIGGIPWYAPPVQRQKWGESTFLPHINWGDLFFDLFYVAAVYNLGVMLITAINKDDYLRGIIYFLGIYGSLFLTWETEIYYSSRYTVVDYTHRLFEVVRFVLISTVVLNIQPIEILSDPFNAVEPLVLAIGIFLESVLHLALNVELYYFGQGDRLAIQMHTLGKIQRQLVPTSLIYLAAVLCASIMYVGPWSSGGSNETRALLQIDDLPLILVAVGYFSNVVFTILRKIKATSGFHGDIRDTFVPNNVDYIIQRYGDWTMLVVGEVVMALVETTESERNYLVASLGTLTLIIMHGLNRESAPSKSDGHALWRNIRNATCFALLMQVLSIGLILLGVAYKIFMTDGNYGISSEISASLFCGSLAVVLLSLELMLISHRGIRRTYMRLYRQESESGAIAVNVGLLVVSLFKFMLFLFLLVLPLWSTDPTTVVIIGFLVVTAIAMTRVVGWGLVFREKEIISFASKAAESLKRGVSFAVESVRTGGSQHGSEVAGLSFLVTRDKSSKKPLSRSGVCETFSQHSSSHNLYDERDIESAVHDAGSVRSGLDDGSIGSSSIHKRENVYDEMFDAVVLTDLSGYIVTVNQTALDVFGFESRDQIIGENVSILVGGGDAEHHDMYLERFHDKEKEASQIGKQRVLYGKKCDGTEFPAIIGIKRSSNQKYLVGYIRDMTGITRSESKPDIEITNIASLDKRVRRVLDDASFDCIVVINPLGIIQGVNSTLVKEFRYEQKEDLVGEEMGVLMGGDNAIRDHHPTYLENYTKRRTREGGGKLNSHVVGRQRMLFSRRKDGSQFRCIIGVHGIEGTDLLAGFIRNVEDFV